MTFATDYQPCDTYDRFLKGLASMDRQLERNGMQRSLTPADIRACHKNGQPTVIQAVEGAHFLQGHVERVEEAYQHGLRLFGLLHDSDASVPLGDVYPDPPRYSGLTSFGASVIKECNRLGILIDLTQLQPANHRDGTQGHDPTGHLLPYRAGFAVGKQSVYGANDAPKTDQQRMGPGRSLRPGDWSVSGRICRIRLWIMRRTSVRWPMSSA